MTPPPRGLARVVLAGRPNVGKSTLFNRISGRRRAIVTPVAGTTRDVMRHPVEWLGTPFELVDTGGVFGASTDPLQADVARRGLREFETAAVIVILVDGRDGVTPADDEVVRQVRRAGAPLVLAINKVDEAAARARTADFDRLAVRPAAAISAEHGLGVGDLLDEVVRCLPGRRPAARRPRDPAPDPDPPPGPAAAADPAARDVRIALVGRPNVGKSSLLNRLAGEDRMLVNARAGTTRDAVEAAVVWHGRRIRLVDTAGIRRPGRVAQAGQVEAVSVVLSRRALTQADVAVLLIDAAAGVARQEAAIAGAAARAGCGLVLAASKWDLVKDRGAGFARTFDAEVRRQLRFAAFAPILHVSARTGERAARVIERAVEVADARARHVGTAELNRVVARMAASHRPSSPGRREVKILYAAQVGVRPPSFVFFTNAAASFHFSYERYLQNQLRAAFGFTGSPIRVTARRRREPAGRRR